MIETQQSARPLVESTPHTVEAHGPGVLWVAIWCALLGGLLEAAVAWARSAGTHRLSDRSPHFMWLVPAANLLLFALPAVLVWILSRIKPTWVPLKASAFIFATPAVLGILRLFPRLQLFASIILAMGLAMQFAWFVSARPRAFERVVYRSVGLLAFIALVSGVTVAVQGRWREARTLAGLPAARAGAPNVLFIILDTVRAASLSLYGYSRATTPNLERLGRESVVFNNAVSTAPWTLPSHASMFTGRYPEELSANWSSPLDGKYPTLAEVLQAQGYYTMGIVANTGYTGPTTGLSRGFTHYEAFRVSLGQTLESSALGRMVGDNFRIRELVGNDQHLNRQHAAYISARFLSAVQRRADRPFFAFLNYYDAHSPYLPETPFDRQFGGGRSTRKVSPLHRWNWDPAAGHRPLAPAIVQEEIDAYDGSLAYLDQQLGLLFDALRSRGLLDNTIVVVTADHGEEFGEHKVFDHGNSLYYASVHVPLIISFPGRVPAGVRIDEHVSLRDIAATVLALSGNQSRALPGEPLTRFWNPQVAVAAPSAALSEVRRATGLPAWFPVSKGDMQALIDGTFRYIRNGDGTEELYNIKLDPWERSNLAGAAYDPERERMRTLMAERTSAASAERKESR